jgi:integrase/recombinase XerD
MNPEISLYSHRELAIPDLVPAVIARAGDRASRRFLEFFTANIRNPNTRRAYYRAVRLFLDWCEHRHIQLRQIEPMIVAAYVEELNRIRAKPTVQQHLAAIRMLCDYLVIGQVLPFNPAASVRGPSMLSRRARRRCCRRPKPGASWTVSTRPTSSAFATGHSSP